VFYPTQNLWAFFSPKHNLDTFRVEWQDAGSLLIFEICFYPFCWQKSYKIELQQLLIGFFRLQDY
jgi:hypothetical protein